MAISLRTLTKKSVIGFGKRKDWTVQRHIDLNKKAELVSIYYKLSTMSFTSDILDEIKIPQEFRINKPGTNKLLYKIVLMQYPNRIRNPASDKLKKRIKNPSKAYMQSKNQGK